MKEGDLDLHMQAIYKIKLDFIEQPHFSVKTFLGLQNQSDKPKKIPFLRIKLNRN